ncbi:hypothetical protein AAC387_Pa08g0898 [Persea americana]
MTTNKDRIERLETDIQELKEGFEKMSEIVSKSIHELSTKLSSDKHATKNSADEDSLPGWGTNTNREGHSHSHSQPFRQAKLDFPSYAGDDPTIWLDHVV